jgi:hypothetical protein
VVSRHPLDSPNWHCVTVLVVKNQVFPQKQILGKALGKIHAVFVTQKHLWWISISLLNLQKCGTYYYCHISSIPTCFCGIELNHRILIGRWLLNNRIPHVWSLSTVFNKIYCTRPFWVETTWGNLCHWIGWRENQETLGLSIQCVLVNGYPLVMTNSLPWEMAHL